MTLSWTTPYYGVQHLTGHPALDRRDFQVTVTEHGRGTAWGAAWYVCSLRGGHPFTSNVREGMSETADAARAAAEQAFLAVVGAR